MAQNGPDCARCENTRIVTAGGRSDYARARRCTCYTRCPLCGGEEYFFETNADGYRFTRPCQCVLVDRKIRDFNDARLPARYANARLQDFFPHTPGSAAREIDPTARSAAQKTLQLVTGFRPGQRGLLFYGPVGTGKTHLVVAALRYLVIRLGVRVRFVEFMHLLADLRATFGDHGRAEDVMRPLVDVPVLAIDELGKGRGSDWEREVLDELISKRYNAHRTTLFTTNYLVDAPPTAGRAGFAPGTVARPKRRPDESREMVLEERIGTRIHSRLMEMCDAYRIDGVDLRAQRAGGG